MRMQNTPAFDSCAREEADLLTGDKGYSATTFNNKLRIFTCKSYGFWCRETFCWTFSNEEVLQDQVTIRADFM